MVRPFALACAAFTLVAPLAAQPAPLPAASSVETAEGPAHAVPFAARGNRLELAVVAPSGALPNVTVRVAEAPAWISFTASDMALGDVAMGSEALAAFAFDAVREAPVGVPATIRLVVVSAGVAVSEHAVRVVAEAPREVALDAPRPNPAHGPVALGYTLPQAERAVLTVYDALGREVARFDEPAAAPGYHAVRWEASGAAAGLYVVRLRAGRAVRTKTLVRVN